MSSIEYEIAGIIYKIEYEIKEIRGPVILKKKYHNLIFLPSDNEINLCENEINLLNSKLIIKNKEVVFSIYMETIMEKENYNDTIVVHGFIAENEEDEEGTPIFHINPVKDLEEARRIKEILQNEYKIILVAFE